MTALMVGAVALGGALGAVIRHLLSAALNHGQLPRGTVAANTIGSAALGATIAWADVRGLHDVALGLLGIGLAGGLTTFSSLAVDALKLGKQERVPHLGAYLLLTFGLGIAAAGGAYEFVAIALR